MKDFVGKNRVVFRAAVPVQKVKIHHIKRCAGEHDLQPDNKSVRGINYTSWRINQTCWLWRRRIALLSNHSHRSSYSSEDVDAIYDYAVDPHHSKLDSSKIMFLILSKNYYELYAMQDTLLL